MWPTILLLLKRAVATHLALIGRGASLVADPARAGFSIAKRGEAHAMFPLRFFSDTLTGRTHPRTISRLVAGIATLTVAGCGPLIFHLHLNEKNEYAPVGAYWELVPAKPAASQPASRPTLEEVERALDEELNRP